MTDAILLEVLTPERRVFSAHVSELQFPTLEMGYYGILPGHTPLVTALGEGLIYYTQDGQKHWLTVFGGFAEVGPDHVTVLARISETVDMIDVTRAEAAKARAERMLKDAITEDEIDLAQIRLAASLIRLQAAGRPGGH
jgi:F-type H+-transporting ATPase subunit epsilon